MNTDLNRINAIAFQIASCDFRVMVCAYPYSAASTAVVICIGESNWSRCVSITGLDNEDPTVNVLVDSGESLLMMTHQAGRAVNDPTLVDKRYALSEFMTDSYVGISDRLKNGQDKCRNGRLDA